MNFHTKNVLENVEFSAKIKIPLHCDDCNKCEVLTHKSKRSRILGMPQVSGWAENDAMTSHADKDMVWRKNADAVQSGESRNVLNFYWDEKKHHLTSMNTLSFSHKELLKMLLWGSIHSYCLT